MGCKKMSQVIKCQVDPEFLRPLVNGWILETNTDKFNLKIDHEKAINDLRQMVLSPDAALFLLVVKDEIVGFSGVLIYETRLTDHRIANEHYWFVLPSYRKGKNPLKLIRAIEKWAKEQECSHMIMNASNLASDNHDRVVRIYERLGYSLFETSYMKEVI